MQPVFRDGLPRRRKTIGRLQDKVALITGAARGHAQAMAVRFAAEGALLAICDLIPVEELDATTGAQIREAGSRALCFRTDVSDERQVNDMVARTLAEYGTIDILAPVVGIAGPTRDLQDVSLGEWQQVLAVNLDSIFLCCKAVLPEMIRRRRGRIIMFSSPSGKQPLAHRTPYTTSKMGVCPRVLASRLAPTWAPRPRRRRRNCRQDLLCGAILGPSLKDEPKERRSWASSSRKMSSPSPT